MDDRKKNVNARDIRTINRILNRMGTGVIVLNVEHGKVASIHSAREVVIEPGKGMYLVPEKDEQVSEDV